MSGNKAALYTRKEMAAAKLPLPPRLRKYRSVPELYLVVHRWPSTKKGSKRARLVLMEADLAVGRSTAEPFADLSLVLRPARRRKSRKGADQDRLPHVVATGIRPRWTNRTKRSLTGRTHEAAFGLRISRSKMLMFKVPTEDFLSEGGAWEISFSLTVGKNDDFDGWVPTTIPTSYSLAGMLAYPNRFADTKRNPHFSTQRAPNELPTRTLALIKAAGKTTTNLDVDGLPFKHVLGSTTRSDFIEALRKTDKKASQLWRTLESGVKEVDFRSSDIFKSYFVIHDIGNNGSVTINRWKPNSTGVKKFRGGPRNFPGHGFLNWDGHFVASYDMAEPLTGTIYTNVYLRKKWRLREREGFVEIENSPDMQFIYDPKWIAKLKAAGNDPTALGKLIPRLVDRTKQKLPYASMGWMLAGHLKYKKHKTKKDRHGNPLRVLIRDKRGRTRSVAIWGWTQATVTTLADLYLLASARAGHLLTVTCHCEMDRNVSYDKVRKIFNSEADAYAFSKFAGDSYKQPGNAHADPFGLDLQVFYDAVTRRLNKGGLPGLGGLQIPNGARYGIHPRRVMKTPMTATHNGVSVPFGEIIGLKGGQPHTFPLQSNPSPTSGGKPRTAATPKKYGVWVYPYAGW